MEPKIITVNTIRGGSGKTLFSVLAAKYLQGKKLVIDSDIQNSLSFWSGIEPQDKNLFNAIINTNLRENIYHISDYLDIVKSDIRLMDIYGLEPSRLKFIKELEDYDYIIIDTAPIYSGIVYNFFQISDLIIMPLLLDFFSFKSTVYTIKKIEQMDHHPEIKVFINNYEKPRTENAYNNQLLDVLNNHDDISRYLSDVMIPKNILLRQLNDNTIDVIPERKKNQVLLSTIKSFMDEVK